MKKEEMKMSEKKVQWTDEQKAAISSKDKSIVVSAAAGSGKTAVLVERVIRKITDKENPIDLDSLIIVTFTVAATTSVKEKIRKALRNLIAENPDNEYLKKQLKKLPNANISTIDSFCQNLVKENFHELNIAPDFQIGDNATLDLLKYEVVEELLEERYKKADENFLNLINQALTDKNDVNIEKMIFSLYEYSTSFAFPEKFFELIVKNYEDRTDENIFYKNLLQNQKLIVDTILSKYEKAINLITESGKAEDKLKAYLMDLYEKVQNTPYEKIHEIDFPPRIPSTTKVTGGALIKELNTQIKKKPSSNSTSNLLVYNSILKINKEILFSDLDKMLPYVKTLCELTLEFADRYKKLKMKNNIFSFNDILHFAINLLYDDKQNLKPLAMSLKENVSEIMIDEYQDTNDAQDLLFRAISDDFEKSFIVGDVKQSIYGFRHAMPDIFLEKINDDKNKNIRLSYNFRSDVNILDFTNVIFGKCMTKETCNIDYSKGHNLKTLNKDGKSKVQIDYLPCNHNEQKEKELLHIINIINKLHREENVPYEDICILLRKDQGKFEEYTEQLKQYGIPANPTSKNDFTDSYEFSVISSFLKILENPTDDIALTSVLTSPCYAFTSDELANIKLNKKVKNLFTALNQEKENPKVITFLDELKLLKEKSILMSVSEIVYFLYDYKKIVELFSCTDGGVKSRENLQDILDFVKSFDHNNCISLSAFLFSLSKIEESDFSFSTKKANSLAKGVKIMTIHNSKGLEFPYVILPSISDTRQHINKENMILDKDFGLSMKYRNVDNFSVENTSINEIFNMKIKNTEQAEELRIFYVAMTRAVKKLNIVLSGKLEKDLIEAMALKNDDKPFTFDVQSTVVFKKLILSCLSNDIKLRGKSNEDLPEMDTTDFDCFELNIVEKTEELQPVEEIDIYENEKADKIYERLNFKYPFEDLTQIPAKITASGFDYKIKKSNFANTKPDFSEEKQRDSYQRGNAYHSFMEFADFKKLKENPDSEIQRLYSENKLTEDELNLINIEKIKNFSMSDLFKKIEKAEKFHREYQFAVNIEAKKFYDNINSDDTLFVQGIFDAVIEDKDEVIILDYKTDFVKNEQELIERYKNQLEIYAVAGEKIFQKKAKKMIYSFTLDKEIEI